MNDVQLDELLALDGARWREDEASPSLALTDAVEQAALDLDLPHIVADSASRRARRWLVAPLAASVVALAVAVHLVAAHRDQTPKPAVPLVPTIAVSYHGLTFQFPEPWAVRADRSCEPTPNYSVIPMTYIGDFVPSCPAILPTTTPATELVFTHTVELFDLNSPGHANPELFSTPTPTTVAGLPASTSELNPNTSVQIAPPTVFVRVPALELGILLTGVDPALVLGSARQTPTDALGCRDHLPSLNPTGNSPAEVIVPATPVSGVVCQYLVPATDQTDYRLVGSRRLTTTEIGDLVSVSARVADPHSAIAATDPHFDLVPSVSPLLYQLSYSDGSIRTVESVAGDYYLSDGQRGLNFNPHGLGAQGFAVAVGN